ncbi:MAG TPA: metallophosphoesterase family protein [Candidatus Brocadiia bacterium]|nr:metallophosphoesterase family protein [Candidatus Brocadiales bacterium]
MRYGILGDIHGNYDALEAVISDIEKEKIDRLLCVGDIVGYGAEPSKCIETVRRLNCISVAGNHDYAVAGKLGLECFNDDAREGVIWTREHLSAEDLEYLANLPIIIEEEGFTLVHGTLHYPELFGYILSYHDAELCFKAMSASGGHLCFMGHSHIPVTFFCGELLRYSTDRRITLQNADKFLVNVGSVGQPRDHNPKATYVIYDVENKTIRVRRLDYDIESAARKIRLSGLPIMNAERLKLGR